MSRVHVVLCVYVKSYEYKMRVHLYVNADLVQSVQEDENYEKHD
jgi:hypothetical protein